MERVENITREKWDSNGEMIGARTFAVACVVFR
jgi:hypothetical protein